MSWGVCLVVVTHLSACDCGPGEQKEAGEGLGQMWKPAEEGGGGGGFDHSLLHLLRLC